jgi:glycine/D-amino acid oxidase-like deaminating enzyme
VFDVAVIGGGILGASAAYHLSRAALSVILMEAGEPAAKATGNSFAWLNAVSKEPEEYHRLNVLGMGQHETLAAQLGIAQHAGGSLTWRAAAAETLELREHAAMLRDRDYAAVEVDCGDMLRLEPNLRIDPSVDGGIWYEGDGWIDPVQLTREMLRQLPDGCEVRSGARVTDFFFAHPRVIGVDVGAERIDVHRVLICAGTDTQRLCAKLGVTVPVEARPGLLAVTEPSKSQPPISRVIHAPGVHMRPELDGGLRIGSGELDNLVTADTPTEPAPDATTELLRRADAYLEGAAPLRLKKARIGVRPWPADGLTVAGRLPGWENAYVAVTHSAVTLAPWLGFELTDEIVGGPPSESLEPFRPDRFSTVR